MNEDQKYMIKLKQCTQDFSTVAAESISAMGAPITHSHIEPIDKQDSDYEGLTVFCNFSGTVQGFFLINISEDEACALTGLENIDDNRNLVNEFFKEIINIASGDSIESLEEYLGHLTYFPPVVSRGEIEFPLFASSEVSLLLNHTIKVHCGIYLNLAEIKIGAELRRMQKSLMETRHSSRIDSLTMVYNRFCFDSDFPNMVEDSLTLQKTLSTLWIDIDLFKQFNDTHGHQVGDEVLKIVGQALLTSIRDSDMAFRYGGDEFILVLRGTPRTKATIVADRINNYLKENPLTVADGELITPTLSIGISDLQLGDTVESLLERTDKALYTAKDRGRNCVVIEP